jgi:hypothetical protein
VTSPSPGLSRLTKARLVAAGLLAAAGSMFGAPLSAQTDYYNTSAGRPLRIEDAQAIEYRAIEFDVAPLRLERARGGSYRWSIHPEVEVGALPRTQLQLGFPLAYVDAPRRRERGLAGMELSVLHSLNVETTIPALAVAADLFIPVGSLAGDEMYATVKGIVTRTFPWGRFHLNAEVTAGSEPIAELDAPDAIGDTDATRWLAGISIDRPFPLQSVLLGAEVFAEQPIVAGAPVAWSAGTGARYQLSPRWALDAGVGRRFTRDDRTWYVTFGSAFVIGIP